MNAIGSKSVIRRGALLAYLVSLFVLLMIRPAFAQTTFGSLSNFDVFNDTGQPCHGFEIELDGVTAANVTFTFGAPYQQYGNPTVTDFAGGAYVRYISPYDPVAKTWAATTLVASTPITPTMGHACWTGGVPPAGLPAYPLGGCDHFGLGLSANPTNTVYRWLIEDPVNPGNLIPSGTKVSIPAPIWSVAQPVPAQPVVVAAVIPAPPLPPVPVCEFGDAQWVKVYVTQSANPADLNHLVSDDPGVPNDPAEIETEWSLSQVDSGIPGGGANAELADSSPLVAGNESVTRRYEFYKYTGIIDPETCEALATSDSNPQPNEIGDYIGAQIGAANVVIPATTVSVPATMLMTASPLGNQVTKSITLKNTGKKNALIVQNVTTDNPEFNHGASTCSAGGVAPGLTCTITLNFTPTALGLRTANLTISDNANTGTQIVALTGTGLITTAVTPATVSIGSVKFGSKMVRSVTVNNKQNQSVSLAAGFAGGNAADFAVTGGTCGALLNAKTMCTMAVTFTPGALGAESTTMTVTPSPDPLAPYSVAFNALTTIPETVLPAKLTYGNVAEGAPKTLNATVTNNAGAPITLGAGVSGPNAADFALSGGTCGATLAGLSSCTYAVTFTPATEAAETASLSITVTEDPASPRIVALAGAGISPLKATPLTGVLYGTVLNGKSLIRNVNVMNASAATLSISEGISGPNAADFAVVAGGTCGATLAGGTSCFYKVAFTPSIVGAESATIGVSAVGDAASPHNVSLSGTGG